MEGACERPGKRRRVAVACDHCRRRKIRCDGFQPVCSYCGDHRIPCVYHKTTRRVHVAQDELNSLHRRVEELQRTNATLVGVFEISDRIAASPTTASEQSPIPPPTEEAPMLPSPRSVTNGNNNETGAGEAEFTTDAMVCAGPAPPAGGSYFGNSSTLAFLEALPMTAFWNGAELGHSLQSTMHGKDSSRRPILKPSVGELPPILNVQSRMLPPRSTADHFVDVYFSRVYDLFTLLHEPSFREPYEQLWQSASHPDGWWLCIVNVVFALGSLFSERLAPLDVESTARMSFTQAKELFNFDSLDRGNVATVQALLLMGQYLQSTNEVNRCWYVFGLAIRTAQGLGMQLNEINNKCPPLERELRKQCWCGCLVMDTMLAMTF